MRDRMGVLDKIAKMVGSQAALEAEATAGISAALARAIVIERCLGRFAELAPHAAGSAGLTELADSQRNVCRRLREDLGDEATDKSNPPAPETMNPAPTNHWSRLVFVLEKYQDQVEFLRRLESDLSQAFPKRAALIADVRGIESAHCEKLRSLIARADPQAAD